MVLSKSGAHIQKPGATTDKGTNRHRFPQGAARVVPVRSLKCGPGRIFMAVPWSRTSRFDARLHDTLL